VGGTSSEAFEILQRIHHKDIISLKDGNMMPTRPFHPALASEIGVAVSINVEYEVPWFPYIRISKSHCVTVDVTA
jgi:hypothetical protein